MYAVIFKARLARPDDEYLATAEKLRKLAKSQFGCLEFVSMVDGDEEVAISYWESEAQIAAWKNDATHKLAQAKGRAKWYKSYRVEICELKRTYEFAEENK